MKEEIGRNQELERNTEERFQGILCFGERTLGSLSEEHAGY